MSRLPEPAKPSAANPGARRAQAGGPRSAPAAAAGWRGDLKLMLVIVVVAAAGYFLWRYEPGVFFVLGRVLYLLSHFIR
jgi:hypothetical protein